MDTPALRSKLYEALEMVDGKLKAIKKVTGKTMVTSGMFSYTPNNQAKSVNIHASTSLSELIEIYSFLREKKSGYDNAAEALGLSSFPQFSWLGYSFENWESDLKIRVAIISSNQEIQKLTLQKKELEKHLTQDDQLGILLKEMGIIQ